MTRLTSCSPSVSLLSLEVSLCSSLTLLAAFFFFFLHSLDMPKWPLSPQVLHVLSSAGHFCPDSCLSYVHLGHCSFSPSPLCLPLYLPICFSFLTSSISTCR